MMKIKKIWYFVKLLWTAIRLQKNPENTALVFDIADILHKLDSFQESRRIIQKDPASMTMMKNRVLVEGYSLQTLSQLPKGTLGQVYAQHMLSNNLDPEFYRRPKVITDESYFFLRMRQTHDLWHVVTGFDTSILGEISLQGFMLAQVASPLSIILVSFALFSKAFDKQEQLFHLFDAVIKGWQMGRAASSLFPYDWEKAWPKDLDTVRRELNLSTADLLKKAS